MKNLYLLPTDKPNPNILLKKNNGEFAVFDDLFYKMWKMHQEFGDFAPVNTTYQNIYITSDEEIKEGDFFYVKTPNIHGGNIVTKCLNHGKGCWSEHILTDKIDEKGYHPSHCKKIILTTDQDLIKDGVQAIEDEFLEWFIKNPTCESVNVEEVYFHGSGYYKASELSEQEKERHKFMREYKIIIPQEKFKCYFINTDVEYLGSDEDKKEAVEKGYAFYKKEDNKKQETLEEAAENYVRNESDDTLKLISKYSFRDGAKWQSKIMYSEEDMKSFGKFCSEYDYRCFGSKTQEEMLSIWFEQFKKSK